MYNKYVYIYILYYTCIINMCIYILYYTCIINMYIYIYCIIHVLYNKYVYIIYCIIHV